MIRLRNLEKKMVVYEIPVSMDGGVRVKRGWQDRAQNDSTGAITSTLRVEHKAVPTSITLAAAGTEGDLSEPLPDRFTLAPIIQAAVTANPPRLKVVAVTAAAPTPAAPVEAPPSPSPAPAATAEEG